MTRDTEEKWFRNILARVTWPDVPTDLHDRIMARIDQPERQIVIFFPLARLSRWVFIAFITTFCFGMFVDDTAISYSDSYTNTPYYSISSAYFIEAIGS